MIFYYVFFPIILQYYLQFWSYRIYEGVVRKIFQKWIGPDFANLVSYFCSIAIFCWCRKNWSFLWTLCSNFILLSMEREMDNYFTFSSQRAKILLFAWIPRTLRLICQWMRKSGIIYSSGRIDYAPGKRRYAQLCFRQFLEKALTSLSLQSLSLVRPLFLAYVRTLDKLFSH